MHPELPVFCVGQGHESLQVFDKHMLGQINATVACCTEMTEKNRKMTATR